MRIYVTDFEAFRSSNIYVIKELCIMNILNPLFDMQHVMLTISTKLDQPTSRYLTSQHHKIPVLTQYDQEQLPYIPDGSILLIKGLEKMRHLQGVYTKCIVMDPFTNNVNSFKKLTTEMTCKYYNHGQHCAYKKCIILLKHFFLF